MTRRRPPPLLVALASVLAAGGTALAQTLPVDPVTATEEVRLEASDAQAFASLGYGASVDDGRIAVGSIGYAGAGTEGAVHVFERAGSAWIQTARVQAPGVAPENQQYWALGLDGDTIVAAGTALGVHVFVESAGAWVEQTVFARPPGESFGSCVALDGDTAVVGAPWADAKAGAVYVFSRAGSTWSQQARLTASDAQADDLFGWSAALDGERLLVGALHADGVAAHTGAAYVFARGGTAWSEEAKLFDPHGTGTPSDGFGSAVSVDGDRAAVGAWSDNAYGPSAGSAFVFVRGGTGWTIEAVLYPLAPSPAASYGTALALHGDRLVVAASQHIPPGASYDRGEAYLLERVGGIWRQRAVLSGSGDTSGDLGIALDFDGRHIVLGDPGDHGAATFAGVALVYTLRAMPEVYCAGKPSSLGCTPFVEVAGRAQVAGTQSFRLRARDLVPGEAGLLLYGSAQADLAFHGGTLCVKPPLVRWLPAHAAAATGSPPCAGELADDFNTRVRSGADPALTAGRTVCAQWLQRDPADPTGFGDSLTDATRFLIGP